MVHALNRLRQPAGPRLAPAGALAEYRAGMVVLKELTQVLGLFRQPASKAVGCGPATR